MNRERDSAVRSGRGMTTSAGFYVGLGSLLLLLLVGALISTSVNPLADHHANPVPANPLPAQVVISPRSNLYHGGSSCPFVHRDSKLLPTSVAVHQGLVPCPYCIGNSSVHLHPTPDVRPAFR